MTETQILVAGAAALALVLFVVTQLIQKEVRRYEEAVLTAMPEHGHWIDGASVLKFVRIRMPYADPWKVYAALSRLERKGVLELDQDMALITDDTARYRTVMPTLLLHDVAVD